MLFPFEMPPPFVNAAATPHCTVRLEMLAKYERPDV